METLSGVKCINRKLICIILIIIYCSIAVSGCGKSKIDLDYKEINTITSTNKVDNKAKTFASNLAVINTDYEGTVGMQVEAESSAGLFDLNSKEVLYAKAIHSKMAPASLTKIMTAYVALRHSNKDDIITCSQNVDKMDYDATRCGLQPGDTLTMNQALHALLINSANDAGVAIAEHISGSVEAFSDLMNQEALSLGATNTHFVNPHGLTDADHYTSAYDLYLITRAAMAYNDFNEIISMTDYETVYKDANGAEKAMSFKTTNLFLRGDYSAPGNVTVIGGKTGTTSAAGNCLILIVKDTAGNPYIGVIMKASERALVNEEMAQLLSEIK